MLAAQFLENTPLQVQITPFPTAASIVLISAPEFAHGWAPLNIARIKAFLLANGHHTTNLSLCVEFSHYLGKKHRSLVALDEEVGEFGHNWHELYFAGHLFGHRRPSALIKQTVKELHGNRDIHHTQLGFGRGASLPVNAKKVSGDAGRIERYCDIMRQFLDQRIEEFDWSAVGVAGFSCVEAQFLTSLYIARKLRARHGKGLKIIFGGPMFQPYNSEACSKSFPEIDRIVVGEGERAILGLLESSDFERPVQILTSLAAPFSQDPIGRGAERLAQYPRPNYDEIKAAGIKDCSLTTYMGKGCSHWRCSFCGISERGHEVRPPALVFEEIRDLVETYGTTDINFGDWEINSDPKRLEELCDLLIAAGIKLTAWAEINARNTSPRLFRKMKQAGISYVQIGVESFSPAVLRHIKKPATLLDNVKVLKWGVEAGMDSLFFNILCNHPLSRREDVEINYRVMRSIAHLLSPPVDFTLNEMELYRTSDMFSQADRYKIRNIRDYKFYQRCYPEERVGTRLPMFNLAFGKLRVLPLWREVDRFLNRVHRRPVKLTMRPVEDGFRIRDTRGSKPKSYRLDGLDAGVLSEVSDRIATPEEVASALEAPLEKVVETFRGLERQELVIEDRRRFLGLPILAKGTATN